MDFSLVEALWTMDWNFARRVRFNLKCIYDGFVSHEHATFHFTRHSLMAWCHVDDFEIFGWIIMFLSCDGTHSL